MSVNITCPIPQALDRRIALMYSKYLGVTVDPQTIAYSRALYYDNSPDKSEDFNNLEDTNENAKKVLNTIYKFRHSQIFRQDSHLAEAFVKLNAEWDPVTRHARIQYIANRFKEIVNNNYQKSNLTREEFIDKNYDVIFSRLMYQDIISKISKLSTLDDPTSKYRVQEFKKILTNWPAIVAFSKIYLKNSEGIVFGMNSTYTTEANINNFNEDNLEDDVDFEESVRESWQEYRDRISAFGTLGKLTRRALSSIPIIDNNGNIVRGDLGEILYLDPIEAHQYISENVRYSFSEKGFMKQLENLSTNLNTPWIKTLLKNLHIPENYKSLPEAQQKYYNTVVHPLRTAFFVDFRKNFQPYMILVRSIKNGAINYKNKIINTTREKSISNKFFAGLYTGEVSAYENSIYNKDNSINYDNLISLVNYIENYFPGVFDFKESTENLFNSKNTYLNKYKGLHAAERTVVLNEILKRLGIYAPQSVGELVGSKKGSLNSAKKIIESTVDLLKFGIVSGKSSPNLQDVLTMFEKAKSNKTVKIGRELSKKVNNADGGLVNSVFTDKYNKIARELSRFTIDTRIERKARHKDRNGKNITLFSDVAPSYLGDFISSVKENVSLSNDNVNLLQESLEKMFLNSSYFRGADGRILCKWINDLYNSKLSNEYSFANMLEYNRFLGSDNSAFENLSYKNHLTSVIQNFFYLSHIEKVSYGYYPTFILGDSGVAKNITAPIYSEEDIIEGMYDVFIQENRRMELTERFNASLDNKKYSHNRNLDSHSLEYVFLSFFNPNFESVKGKGYYNKKLKEDNSKENVKALIKEYLEEGEQAFLKDCQKQNIITLESEGQLKNSEIDKVKVASSTELNNLVKGRNKEKSLDSALHKFYINYKFATIQQFQLMTIDIAFYENAKDLQKRYKEIHAPGTSLHLEAIDSNGEYYMKDSQGNLNTTEKVAYIKDIKLNSEIYDVDFMNSILLNFCDKSKLNKVKEAIKEDIVVPLDDPEKEAKRLNTIKGFLGKNYRIYDNYRKCSLTDGQAWRTLDSYRKILGCTQKWTDEMERAYVYIKEIENTYVSKNLDIPDNEYKKLVSLSSVFQPIKPYYYGIEDYNLGTDEEGNHGYMKIPVQHKNAEIVVIPALLPKGNKLRDMALWAASLDDAGDPKADVIMADSCVKVGAFGVSDVSNITDSASLYTALNAAYIHKLDYSNYRIQTNVPEHIHCSRLVGTQQRKIVPSQLHASDYSSYLPNFNATTGFRLNNRVSEEGRDIGNIDHITPENLVRIYNSLTMANILDDFEEVETILNDPKKVSKVLQQAVLNNNRESLDNLLAFSLLGEDFFTPLFEAGIEYDSAALLFSVFKNRVNKQQMLGGSAVQASAFGLKGYSETGDLRYVVDPNNPANILYAECEIPWDLSYTDNSGRTIELDFQKYCNPDGTLKLVGEAITDPSEKSKYLPYAEIVNGKEIVKIPKIERDFPGILSMVAYRIPTEREYSLINLKIKRFSPKTAGGTIKVPFQGTVISGFDFDIDKLYFSRHEYDVISNSYTNDELYDIWANIYEQYNITDVLKNRRGNGKESLHTYWNESVEEVVGISAQEAFDAYIEEHPEYAKKIILKEYDYSKTPLDNTRAARNNLLLDITIGRLMDPESFIGRYSPGAFPEASRAARFMRELKYGSISINDIMTNDKIDDDKIEALLNNPDPEPIYDPTEPSTLFMYNQQNQIASKLIGIFANHNANHRFISNMEQFSLKPKHALKIFGYTDRISMIIPPEGVDVTSNVAELLSASVDAVKDPVLNYLNLNEFTANAAATLIRLGYSFEEVGIFFNQPIIKEVCTLSANNGCSLSTSISEIKASYEEALRKETSLNEEPLKAPYSKASMIESIVKYERVSKISGKNFITQQLLLLDEFDKVNKYSGEVSTFVSTTKFTAANSVSSTFGGFYAQQDKVNKYLSTDPTTTFFDKRMSNERVQTIYNDESPIDKIWDKKGKQEYINTYYNHTFGYEQLMYDCNRKVLKSLSKFYPYNNTSYIKLRSVASTLSLTRNLSEDTIDALHRDFPLYLLTLEPDSELNPLREHDRGKYGIITNKEYYTKKFPMEFVHFLESLDSSEMLPFLNDLEISVDTQTGDLSISNPRASGYTRDSKDLMKNYWESMIKSDNIAIRKAGIELAFYNIYKYGFSFTPSSIWHLLSAESKQQLFVGKNALGNNITYIEFLKEIQNGSKGIQSSYDTLNTYLKLFMLNNLENKQFTTFVEKKAQEFLIKNNTENGRVSSTLKLNLDWFKDVKDPLLIQLGVKAVKVGEFYKYIYPPLLYMNNSYYMISNSNDNDAFNVSYSREVKYVKVTPKGKMNVSVDYSPTINDKNSLSGIEHIRSNPTEDIPTKDKDCQDIISVKEATDQEILKALENAGIPVTKEYSRAEIENLIESNKVSIVRDKNNNLVC